MSTENAATGQGSNMSAPAPTVKSPTGGVVSALLPTVLLSCGVALAMVTAYHIAFGRGGVPLATVDLTDVFTSMQRKATSDLMNESLTPEEKERVKKDYVAYGERFQAEIDRIGRECRCLIVAKQVVLNERAHDYTALVKRNLGL